MTERRHNQLRSQLSAARDNYVAARYTGDLALDVLPSRMSIALGRAGWALGAVAAVAAVVSIIVMVHRAPTPSVVGPPTVALVDQARVPTSMPATPFSVSAESITSSNGDTTATTVAELPLAAAPPGPPTDVTSFVPSYQSIAVESVPSFPSFDSVLESQQQQQSQQQEQSNTTNSREAS